MTCKILSLWIFCLKIFLTECPSLSVVKDLLYIKDYCINWTLLSSVLLCGVLEKFYYMFRLERTILFILRLGRSQSRVYLNFTIRGNKNYLSTPIVVSPEKTRINEVDWSLRPSTGRRKVRRTNGTEINWFILYPTLLSLWTLDFEFDLRRYNVIFRDWFLSYCV